MADVLARLRVGKLDFETMVDLDNAMKLKKGQTTTISDVIKDNNVYISGQDNNSNSETNWMIA